VITQVLSLKEPFALEYAVNLLHQGQLVAFPTDTVYGLGALISDPQAIEQLYMVKGRDAAKAIAVLLGKAEALGQVTTEMGDLAQKLAQNFWPGPLTLVVARRPDLPEKLSAYPTVGVRMPDHPDALELLNRTGPLAVTSANLSGMPSASNVEQVLEQLGGRIPLILDGGQTPGGQPSTVVDCTGAEPTILRQGPITLQKLRSVL
jgi:L-threonylcarbamoyladenylate synthase